MFFLQKISIFICISAISSSPEFQKLFENISVSTDCQKSEDLGPNELYYEDSGGNVFCYRKKSDGSLKLGSTSRDFTDPRFMCSNGPMQWYRGRRNVAFDNSPCEFWSTVNSSTVLLDISSHSFSSYSMRRFLPDEYENFCRNPDRNPIGPWCWVKKQPTPCFLPCRSRLSDGIFVCLNKLGFPYHSEDYDLSDLVDLPELVGSFENVQLQFENRRISPLPIDRYQTKTCVNSGKVAGNFGPWIAVLDESAREFIKILGRRKLWELCTPEFPKEPKVQIENRETTVRRELIMEDEITAAGCTFWRQCFSACQDDAKICWNHTDSEYFGTRKTSKNLEMCIPWTKATSMILTNKTDPIYEFLLFKDPQKYFVENRIFLNTESFCMNFQNQTETTFLSMERTFNSTFNATDENVKFFREEFQKVFQQGPGCFVQKNENLATFESCFQSCEDLRGTVAEMKLTERICLKSDLRYEICESAEDEEMILRGRKKPKKK